MALNGTSAENNSFLESAGVMNHYEFIPSPEIVNVQPEKKDDVIPVFDDKQIVQNSNNSNDCIECLSTCCNFLTECWYCIFACSTCFEGSTCECIAGICEGCSACLQGCGDCCAASSACCQ